MSDDKKPIEKLNEDIKTLEEKTGGKLEGLADKVSSAFWWQIKNFIIVVVTGMQTMSHVFWDDVLIKPVSFVTGFFIEGPKNIKPNDVTRMLQKASTPGDILKGLEAASKDEPILEWIFSIVQYGIAIIELTSSGMQVTGELAQQELSKKIRQTLLPVQNLVELYYRDPSKTKFILESLAKYGFSEQNISELMKTTEVLLSPDILRESFLRGKISDSEYVDKLKQLKLSNENIEIVKSIIMMIPPVQDLITMAVREVFSPGIREKFGQDQDFPHAIVEWGEKAGISEYWLRNYWAAHWQLPSVLQGFEMLHRKVINQGELDMLLRAVDVMPFWRDKLVAISYNPLTRVDVRRMFALGVLDLEGVNKAYHDVGYNDENAALMTEFTVKYVQGKARELTKTDILSLYKDYAISKADCLDKLLQLGYDDDDARMIITKADFEKYAKYKNGRIASISAAYIGGKIDETEALNRLGKLDLPATEINYLINTWDIKRSSKIRYLSLDNLKAFYHNSIISTEELRQELYEIGYNKQDTERFIQLFGIGG